MTRRVLWGGRRKPEARTLGAKIATRRFQSLGIRGYRMDRSALDLFLLCSPNDAVHSGRLSNPVGSNR